MPIIILSAGTERELEAVYAEWEADPYKYVMGVTRDEASGNKSTTWTKTDAGTVTVAEVSHSMHTGKHSVLI